MTESKSKILVVDDEPVIHAVVREALSQNGRELLFAATVAEGLELARTCGDLDVALLDKNLPDGSGMEVARALKQLETPPEVILMTGYASLDSAVEALKIGAFDYVTKPFDDINKLALQVQNALDKSQLKREQRSLLGQLNASQQRFVLAAQGSNDGLWDWDLVSNDVYFSDRWKSMLGYDAEAIGTLPDEWLRRIHADDAERVEAGIRAHLDGHVEHFQDEHRMQHKDGTYRWVLARALAVRDPGGPATRIAGSLTDVTERRLAEQQLQYDALHDPVTLLPNRLLFLDRLGQALARSRRRPNYRFAVVLLDLDRFKIVNESLGHTTGDELLVATARRLETCLRAGDTAARLGGDEFAVLLDDIPDVNDALRVAERIQEELSLPHKLSGQDVFTTSSIGIASCAPSYERPEELLRDADIAMYRAKALGRARHVVFDPAMHGRAVRMLELDSALRLAVERDEFIMHYQPIIALDTGKVVGVEALVRWMHPERGMVSPGEFIPVAEDTGLIVPISGIVLRKAARQVHAWNEGVRAHRPLYVSVNVSAKHLMTRGLIDEFKQIIAEAGLRPSNLRIEITESVVMENADVAAETLEALKKEEIQVYMDDFGTGYSSLSYLHRLPIDALKVDRSFVSNLGIDGENSVIVHTIITLARVMGMEVIAEGVETPEQLAQLRALKCDHAQGFFMSRPQAADAIEKLLEEDPQW